MSSLEHPHHVDPAKSVPAAKHAPKKPKVAEKAADVPAVTEPAAVVASTPDQSSDGDPVSFDKGDIAITSLKDAEVGRKYKCVSVGKNRKRSAIAFVPIDD